MPAAVDLRSVVTSNVIFGALAPEEVDRLLAAAAIRFYEKDQQIFQQGDLADGLYLVVSGRVGIRTLSEDGSEIFLNILETGAVLGEIAAVDGGARTAGAVAMERSDLLFVDRRTFHGLMLASPPLCVSLLTLMCERLRWTSSIIEDAHFRDVRTRLARRLHKLVAEYGVPDAVGVRIRLKMTQEMLARMLGATRESVNKELMGLQRAGVLSYSRGYVTILNSEELRRAIEQQRRTPMPPVGTTPASVGTTLAWRDAWPHRRPCSTPTRKMAVCGRSQAYGRASLPSVGAFRCPMVVQLVSVFWASARRRRVLSSRDDVADSRAVAGRRRTPSDTDGHPVAGPRDVSDRSRLRGSDPPIP